MPTNDLSTCTYTYARGGLYRITLAMADPGGNNASTSTMVFVPANGFPAFAKPPVLHGPGCTLCRDGTAVAPRMPAAPDPATAGQAVASVTAPGRAVRPVPDAVVVRRNGCVAQEACAATTV